MINEILPDLEKLRDKTDFIIKNYDEIEMKSMEEYLRNFERTRYDIFNKIKLTEINEMNNEEIINYINNKYKAEVKNGVLKIFIPEVIPKFKNINNYAYKNIMINVMEKTKQFKNLFNKELVFVFIKVVENQKNIDIDNKFIKPIVDGLVLSKVIDDDNVANMFYGVIGITEKTKNPYTEVYVFKGKKMLKWIQNTTQTDILKISD